MSKKLRAINEGPQTSVAKARQELYRQCTAKIKECMQRGFYLEAITLIESMIADRLESRLSFLNPGCMQHRLLGTIGQAFQYRPKANRLGLLRQEPERDLQLCHEEVINWARMRKECLHEMVKYSEEDTRPWPEKYSSAKEVARDGTRIFRILDRLVKRTNRPAIISKANESVKAQSRGRA